MKEDIRTNNAQSVHLMARLWRRLPVIVRAILIGELVVSVGALVPELAIVANLKTSPQVPWLLVVTALWLWLFWWYLNGGGWPKSTSETRRRDFRGGPLSARVWKWALVAGSFGILCTMGLAFALARLANVPHDAFKAAVDFSVYPRLTVIAALLAISATAGVVEEAGFRGFMLSPIQRRHGWSIAILITGSMFFLDHHLSHAYATFAFLPFFLAISVVHGLLIRFTGSIRPSALLHGVADFCVVPIMYGLVGSFSVSPVWETGFDRNFAICLAAMLIFGVAATAAFVRLAHCSKPNQAAAANRWPS
jgi:membrane protease YdiL (CAAX protease family)